MGKWESIKTYLLALMGERSTWQGIGFLVGLTGSTLGAGVDWGSGAAIGGAISALIKIILTDKADKSV